MRDHLKLIERVQALPDWQLRLELRTGSVLYLNLKSRLHTVRYYALRDEGVFQTATTDGFYLSFRTKNGSSLSFSLREAVLMALNPPPDTYSGFNPFQEA